MKALDAKDEEESVVQERSIMHFHMRLGHLACDTIERMAREPGSGIKLTDKTRESCLTCAQGKQPKNLQSKKGTGATHRLTPLAVPSAHILKNLSRLDTSVELRRPPQQLPPTRTKDRAAEKVKLSEAIELLHSRFRTDGGGEYRVLDPFCGDAGVRRQISEGSNQASNGKAERMHRTILNMACLGCQSNLGWMLFNTLPTYSIEPRPKTFAQRAQPRIIVGKSDETKGFSIYLPNAKKVAVTQHIQSITMLSDSQNTQWQREMLDVNKSIGHVDATADTTKAPGSKKKRRSFRLKQQRKASIGAAPRMTRSTAGGLSRNTANQVRCDVTKAVREAYSQN
ncbi:hypothetical protein PHMEG_00027252 [Phytophthora megakarya]|uniref:GAG-pre-integrase domain-containing protein n=1 Tax=Phytophthora megakarya TaxID=4795 RepID=A0A225V8D0_9STRA|nr:hypothetical protein PHMEG_00027252 [Phytophthora megakarya]